MPPIGIGQDSAIIDLGYLLAGLVTITQFHLVHRVPQGVEHTNPAEWSSSHLLHWRQIYTSSDTTSGGCVAFIFIALVILGEVVGLGCTVADNTLEADFETPAAYEPLGAVTAPLPFDGCCGS